MSLRENGYSFYWFIQNQNLWALLPLLFIPIVNELTDLHQHKKVEPLITYHYGQCEFIRQTARFTYCARKHVQFHQVTTMLATSKNVRFLGYKHLLTTSTYDPTLRFFFINTYTAKPGCWSGWVSDSYCCIKPLCSGMGEVVPARTSPTLLPPSPRTVLSFSCFKVSQCINCRD